MEIVHAYHQSPILIGIDPARKQDSTVATAVWVDWDNPDEYGFMEHRILNWLDLTGMDWEEQYFRIHDFARNYSTMAIGVDEGGLGDVVISRLRVMMPDIEIVALGSARPEQSKRWKYLMELMDRGLLGWPAHAHTRRLKVYKKFIQQMSDLEKNFIGPHMLAEAPDEAGAHDDFCDSASLGIILSRDYAQPTISVSNNFLYKR